MLSVASVKVHSRIHYRFAARYFVELPANRENNKIYRISHAASLYQIPFVSIENIMKDYLNIFDQNSNSNIFIVSKCYLFLFCLYHLNIIYNVISTS